jgi:hypothetical protein
LLRVVETNVGDDGDDRLADIRRRRVRSRVTSPSPTSRARAPWWSDR